MSIVVMVLATLCGIHLRCWLLQTLLVTDIAMEIGYWLVSMFTVVALIGGGRCVGTGSDASQCYHCI